MPPRSETNPRHALWLAALALVAAITGVYWQARPRQTGQVLVRSVVVRQGALERTMRLTGATAPERFASLIAPQMRGSRGGLGGGGSSFSSGSTSSSSTGSSGSSSTSKSPSSTSTAKKASSTLSTALNRFSTPSSGGSSTSSSRSASATTADLGSTATNLPGGGGGGGGFGAFDLILQSLAPPGSRVRKGQVIAEFDRQYVLTRLDDYRSNLDQMSESLKSLQANLDLDEKAHRQSIETARATLEKARYDLKTIPVQGDIAAEQLKLAAQEAEADYKQLLREVKNKEISRKANLRINVLERDQYKIEVDRAIANADKMVAKAPIDGITVMSTTFRGSEFSQFQVGDEVHHGQMFMRVVDLSSMVVQATVNQVDIEQMKVGAQARVRFDAYPDLELPAHVYAIGAMPKTGGVRASFVREVPVTVRMDRLDPRVVPDLSVSVDVVMETEPEAVIVPVAAVFHESGGNPYVFVQAPSGWERREVELGVGNYVSVVVRSGLKPGERVALERPPQPAG